MSEKGFVFHNYYCNHCPYGITGECGHPKNKGCSCYYERGVQQKEYYFRAIEMAKNEEEKIIDQLVQIHDKIDFYRRSYQEAKARVDAMEAIDAAYAKRKDGA